MSSALALAMRIAALSDIHGNIWALEAARADSKEQGADVVVNPGDILSGPLEPLFASHRVAA